MASLSASKLMPAARMGAVRTSKWSVLIRSRTTSAPAASQAASQAASLAAIQAASLAAIQAANHSATPWVLDPVAVGGLAYRTDFAHQLLSLKPAAIRGNASEIMALSGLATMGRGVDSVDSSVSALPAARQLALQVQTVVAVTGEVDYITDGLRDFAVTGGDKLMTRVVGTGCALSAVVAAFCALEGDRLHHVATACRVMSQVGGQVSQQVAGPGSFIPAFLDGLYQLKISDLL